MANSHRKFHISNSHWQEVKKIVTPCWTISEKFIGAEIFAGGEWVPPAPARLVFLPELAHYKNIDICLCPQGKYRHSSSVNFKRRLGIIYKLLVLTLEKRHIKYIEWMSCLESSAQWYDWESYRYFLIGIQLPIIVFLGTHIFLL